MSNVDTCQWLGQGECCDQPAVRGRSYCEHHVWRIYQQGTAVRRRRDTQRADNVHLWESLINEAVEELEAEGL